jgi:predicted Zn-dependent peptidase
MSRYKKKHQRKHSKKIKKTQKKTHRKNTHKTNTTHKTHNTQSQHNIKYSQEVESRLLSASNNIKLYKNDNGTRLLLMPNKNDSSTASIYFYFKVGSKYEPIELNGISHFIEHLVYKGSRKLKSYMQITKPLDAAGISFNAYTSKNITAYYYKFLSSKENMDLICKITSDIIFHSLMRQSDIDVEREVVIQEYNDDLDDIDEFIDEELEKVIFGKHPLAYSIIGDLKSLHNIKRSNILEYYKKFYTPDNLLIGISGNINPEYINILNKYLGEFKDVDINSQGVTTLIPFLDPVDESDKESGKTKDNKFIVKCYPKSLKQDYIHIIFKTKGYFDTVNNNKYKLIGNILGGNMSSRFFIEIREKLGLVYSIKCGLNNYEEVGYFDIYMQNEAKDTNKCIETVLKELNKFKKDGAKLKELQENIKNYCDTFLTGFDDIDNENEYYSKQVLFNKPIETIKDRIESIRNITNEDLKVSSCELFDYNKMIIVCFGRSNKKQIENIIRKYN